MKLVNIEQLLNNAWKGGNNCFVVNWLTNEIEAVNIKKTYIIPEAKIMDVACELACKGIDKYGFEFRAANLIVNCVIGREKEFNKYIKSKGLDKITKPYGELLKMK